MKKTFFIIVLLFTIGTILFFKNFNIPSFAPSDVQKKFNQTVWIESDTDKDLSRYEMYEDLAKEFIKLSMTEKQILDLLGRPDKREVYSIEGKIYITYVLTTQGFDPTYLILEFDMKGKLKSFKKVTV